MRTFPPLGFVTKDCRTSSPLTPMIYSMTRVWILSVLVGVSLLTQLQATPGADVATQDALRLQAVKTFADNVLKDAVDRYRVPATPLLANGVNVFSKEHLLWKLPDGTEAVFSDFVIQQNLMRVLTALSNLSGEPKYKEAAKAQISYYFDHLQDRSGLLIWGGHRFIDLKTLKNYGPDGSADSPHELKNAFPYYELMYEVNPEKTAAYIKAFWNAHVYDWHTLEISRHGEFGHPAGVDWTQRFDDPKPYFETKGLSFLDAGNDLIYSGATLYKLTGDKGALLWSKRLAQQYVKARNPKTGLGAYQYTQPRKTMDTDDPNQTFSMYGDRAKRQFGPEFPGHLVLEATVLFRSTARNIYAENALMQLQIGQDLGAEGREILEWTRTGMVAFATQAQVPGTNMLRQMLTDGTDLSGFVVRRNGYYCKEGTRLDPYPATAEFMLSYARGFLITGDPVLWKLARDIALGGKLGDIGSTPGENLNLNLGTDSTDVYALFSLLDLFQQTKQTAYLELARVIGNNIVERRFHHGYFTDNEKQPFANINALEPYALLALDATIKGEPDKVPKFINGFGFYAGGYRFPDGKMRQVNDAELYQPRSAGRR